MFSDLLDSVQMMIHAIFTITVEVFGVLAYCALQVAEGALCLIPFILVYVAIKIGLKGTSQK